MKYTLIIVIVLFLTSCNRQSCPTTDKRYFTRGLPKSKPLYKGYRSVKENQVYRKK